MSAQCGMLSAEWRRGFGHAISGSARELFPLTPALSLGEREKQRHCGDEARPFAFSTNGARLFPLPEGEGQGGEPTGENSLSRLAFGKDPTHA